VQRLLAWRAALNFLGLLRGVIDIEAEYLSGCDGANSMVRRAVDIKISVRTLAHIAIAEKAGDFLR
jgi:2-polyprenyl-6-methoxyphenol hydroxylase-like FAD-dependent oxidoreductase